jgi:CubicO group peptidase (beta-lactamase class C family)
MFLLGVVIEKVTGEDYFDHIREAIYAPAGMANSDCYEMDYPVENLAIGYSPDFTSPYKWQNNLYKHVIKGGPAGGGFSTVKDLHRFALALLSGKLVSKAMLETMWADFKGANYGYGFQVSQSPMGKIVGHSGGFPGINSKLDIYVDSGYIVAVMSNCDDGASPLADKTRSILARVKAAPIRPSP